MKALVKYGVTDGDVELREVPEPEIGPEDVLLEVKAAGVCGSDIEMWHHKVTFPVNVPVIQGHEFCGVIKEIGAQVKGFKPGDRVVSETAAHICGHCYHCRAGEYNLCPERKGYGSAINGCFTKYVKVLARILHYIPENVDFDAAALTEPACVAYNAVFIKSHLRPGEPVAVIGPGPIGLFAVQMARIGGAYPIILIGTAADAGRMEIGQKIGANMTINVSQEDPEEVIGKLTGGLGVPLVIDAAGNNAALKTAMALVRRNGQITKIGWGPKPVDMSLDPIIAKAATLQGSFSHTWSTWEAVLQLIANGTIMMEPMITHRFPLDKWEEAFRLVDAKVAVKVVIHPGVDN
ncbi:MAG: L-iditol 2-dehydrogenase [Moorella sp. (in: firmicutes)]|nr:L-iditol 2-dehydrogenase [Moorella sp. (in: firmicutes)]